MVVKAKKIIPTLILEEDEVIENLNENILFPQEKSIEITPIKKRKTKKQRENKLIVNPPGKKGTRKMLPVNIEIDENANEEIY